MNIDVSALARYAQVLRLMEAAYDLSEAEVTPAVVRHIVGIHLGREVDLSQLGTAELSELRRSLEASRSEAAAAG